MRTDDPVFDFLMHDAKQQERMRELPHCEYCDEPIVDDFYYDINGDIVCAECLDAHYKKQVWE